MIKRLIRLLARRTAEEHAQSGWLEVLHLQWRAMQSLAIGFMWLCVMLFLLEGERQRAVEFAQPACISRAVRVVQRGGVCRHLR